MDLDSQICYCFHIKKRKIVNFVKQTRPKRASQISECFGAGTGCGWCIPFLIRIHHQVVAGDIVESEDISPAEYEALRASYRQEVRDGTRDRNTHAAAVVPPEFEASIAPEPADSTRGRAPDDTDDTSETDTSEKVDWDVSDYFSRPPPPEPEPDTLE